MTFVRVVLFLDGLTFFGLGAAFFLWPETMASFVGIGLDEPSARTDIRAVYGGGEIGIGVFFFVCARRPEYVRAGVLLGILCLGGLAFFRSASLLFDGPQPPITYALLASEVLGFGLNVVAHGARRRAAG